MRQLPLILFLPLLVLSGCRSADKPESAEGDAANTGIPTVEVITPKQRIFPAELFITGNVEANQEVMLYAQVEGYLKSIKVDIGDHVKAGQLIATIENPDLFYSYQKAKADFGVKEIYYKKLEKVYRDTPDLTTTDQVDIAKAEYEALKAIMQGLAAKVGFLNVKAPFSGIVTARYVDAGAAIQSGSDNPNATAIVEIKDLTTIRVATEVPEPDVPLISDSTKVMITFPEMSLDTFRTTVTRLAYSIHPTAKTMKIEIDLPNPDLMIRPGMYAKLTIFLKNHENAFSVPKIAIATDKGQNYIYRIIDQKAKRENVRLGFGNEYFVEILGLRLSAEDHIIISGKEMVSDGTLVKAINKSTND
ncbi:MAG: efflux RND transporter periplasmic adaptor subunit [Bacteroidetes bacterium]|nr:efflux RND transporter periplasmic adaptor subunit [Bacteroidota bacterium]